VKKESKIREKGKSAPSQFKKVPKMNHPHFDAALKLWVPQALQA
jgi:hypothetical protein